MREGSGGNATEPLCTGKTLTGDLPLQNLPGAKRPRFRIHPVYFDDRISHSGLRQFYHA